MTVPNEMKEPDMEAAKLMMLLMMVVKLDDDARANLHAPAMISGRSAQQNWGMLAVAAHKGFPEPGSLDKAVKALGERLGFDTMELYEVHDGPEGVQ